LGDHHLKYEPVNLGFRRAFSILVVLLLGAVSGQSAAVGAAAAVVDWPLARLSFQPSMAAGFRDTNGKLVAGTEVMHLVPRSLRTLTRRMK